MNWNQTSCCSVTKSSPAVPLHGLLHTRLPCPPPSPRTCSNSCPLSQRCHPTISSSAIPFSSCLHSFPALGSFPMNWLFASGGQSIRASEASASLLQWIFRVGLLPKISTIALWFPVYWQQLARVSVLMRLGRSLESQLVSAASFSVGQVGGSRASVTLSPTPVFCPSPSPACHAQYSTSLSNCWNLCLPWSFLTSQKRKSQTHLACRILSILENNRGTFMISPRTPLPFLTLLQPHWSPCCFSNRPSTSELALAVPSTRPALLQGTRPLDSSPPRALWPNITSSVKLSRAVLLKHVNLWQAAVALAPCDPPLPSGFCEIPPLEGWLEEVTHSVERGQAEGLSRPRWGWRKTLSSDLLTPRLS